MITDEESRPQSLKLSIMTKSIDTGHPQRDGHLRAPDFIFGQKYPAIVFESTSIQEAGANKFLVKGRLSLRGVTRPWEVAINLGPAQLDSWGYESRFAKFKTLIKRSDFGIQWNKTLADNKYLVGDEVTVWGSLQLQPQNRATPTSKHMIPDTPSIRQGERLRRGEITAKEYAQVVGLDAKATAPVAVSMPRPVTPMNVSQVKALEDDIRHTMRWQVWFWILGLLGFFASLVLALYGKKLVMDTFQQKYEETGKWGNLSDVFTIGFTFLYAVAFWMVGWG